MMMNSKKLSPYKTFSQNPFTSEEKFQEIYSKCLEDEPPASQNTMDNYRGMRKYLDEYLRATQEDTFRYAYQCGYEAGIKAASDIGR